MTKRLRNKIKNDMAIKFDILTFAGTLTGYDIEKTTLEYILLRRGLQDVTSYDELTQRDIDLLTADCLKVAYTTPTITASQSDSHGDYTRSRGSQTITDKRQLYQWMMGLYKKWGENPFEDVDDLEGGVRWME